MLETNIQIVRPGSHLELWVRRAAVDGPDLGADLLQRACGTLRYRYRLAAVPHGGSRPSLLVATKEPIPSVRLEREEWVLDVTDAEEPSRSLRLSDPEGASLIPSLIERAILAELSGRTDFWTLDSPRIWYEAKPFKTQEGISAYRRLEVCGFTH